MWAIDSLSGVVLSGLPRGALSSSKTTAPKAVLWGRCGSSRNTLLVVDPSSKATGVPSASPRGAAAAGAPAVSPRGAAAAAAAAAALVWLQPGKLFAATDAVLGLSAYVVYPEGVPVSGDVFNGMAR